jgi:hypothetical protein
MREAARTTQLPNWWGLKADRWAGAVRAEDGNPGIDPCPVSCVMRDYDVLQVAVFASRGAQDASSRAVIAGRIHLGRNCCSCTPVPDGG